MGNKYDSYESHASVLKDITIFSDKLDVSPQGHLVIDGCDVRDLDKEYGSPLYVYSEKTFRENIRALLMRTDFANVHVLVGVNF